MRLFLKCRDTPLSDDIDHKMERKVSGSLDDLDSAIYVVLGTRQLKMARVVGQIYIEKNIPCEDVAMRVKALVASNKLEGFGNLDNWRFSEVRVKVA